MNRTLIVPIGLATLAVAALSGCSDGKEAPATVASSATTTSATQPATTSAPTSTTASTPASSTPTSSSAESPTTSSSAPMVGGMTECTKVALAEPATAAAQAMGPDNVYTVETLDCADGWAVTGGVLASKDNPNVGAPTSFIFEQQGQFWVLQDKAEVCGTNPTTTTPPADALIPALLFVPGCAAG